MLSHDPAFGFHLICYVLSLVLCFGLCSLSLCALCALLWLLCFLCPFVAYSANHPLASSSFTPMRLLPSISSIHEPFTSAVSLPPNCGTSFTVDPIGISTSI